MASRSALVTVRFTDIVGSTEVADELGDSRWRELRDRHHRIVRGLLRRFGGREVDVAGDGFFATFDRPTQAVRCAAAACEQIRQLGIEIRTGVHVGELEEQRGQVAALDNLVGAGDDLWMVDLLGQTLVRYSASREDVLDTIELQTVNPG